MKVRKGRKAEGEGAAERRGPDELRFESLAPAWAAAAPPARDTVRKVKAATQDTALEIHGSFSAGSTPIFAIKYSFCSIFRDLQNGLA